MKTQVITSRQAYEVVDINGEQLTIVRPVDSHGPWTIVIVMPDYPKLELDAS